MTPNALHTLAGFAEALALQGPAAEQAAQPLESKAGDEPREPRKDQGASELSSMDAKLEVRGFQVVVPSDQANPQPEVRLTGFNNPFLPPLSKRWLPVLKYAFGGRCCLAN